MKVTFIASCLTLGLMGVAHGQSFEQGDPRGDSVFIENEALSGARGRIAVNAAAGVNNQQANAASVAFGGQTSTFASVGQSGSDGLVRSSPINNQAWILNGVLGDARGLLSINQASGDQNRQSNTMVIDVADTGSSGDDILAGSVAGPQSQGTRSAPSSGRREAGIAPGAFSGANGVVQINQAAGMQNVTANVIQFRTLGLSAP
jgi:hypothetical protein